MTLGSPQPRATWLAGFYCVVLLTLFNLAVAGLVAVPIQFILKNQLHLAPTQISGFGFISDAPYFVGFAFGFLRDRWRPFGRGDRGYFVIVPILMAATYAATAWAPHTYAVLVTCVVLVTALSALLGAAAQGIVAAVAKDFGMMGRLSVVSYMTMKGGIIFQQSIGGWLGDHTGPAVPFLLSAGVCLVVPIMALWHPKAVFRSGDEVFETVIPEGAGAAFRRLLRHRAIYVPALVVFLWDFAPGWGTPLLFYLTNTIKLSETAYGASQGWLRFGQVAASLAYAWLCTRFRFKPLLNWGTLLGVLGGAAFLLIHTPGQANVICFLAGASCGIAFSAYIDLLFRCCPKELEGVAYMVTYASFTFAADTSDILGSWLYEKGGFGLALAISVAFTAMIFIPIAFLPKSLADPQEGERIVDEDPPEVVATA